jgi:molybdenum cofactor synthesis domain-containing protein
MYNVGILTISDKSSKGQRIDSSGDYVVEVFRGLDIDVAKYEIVADEGPVIAKTLSLWADSGEVDFIITTGGTGISLSDVTPEATKSILDREIPGITELMRADGYNKTPTAILSRAIAGVRGNCLIINLPGNPGAVEEYLDLLMPVIHHAIETLQGRIGNHP